MAAPGWIELFVAPLTALGLPYMVTGPVASMLQGEPRLTLDAELRRRGLEDAWRRAADGG